MASFEIQRTQATPSGRAGAVPMNVNVDTGADAVGQAFASLGNRIYELQANKQNAENAIKKSELRLQYQTRTSEALRELETTFNADEQQEIIGRYQSDITALGTGIPDVDQDFTEYRNNTLAGNLEAFERTVHKNQIISLNDQFDINYQKTLETGSRQTASDLIDNMVQAGAISPERAEAMKGEWSGDMRLTRAKKMIETGDPNEIYNAETVLTFMSDQATNNPGEFTAKQMNVLDNLKTQLDATKNRKNSELREQQDKDSVSAFEMAEQGTLTWEWLQSSSLNAQQREHYWEKYKRGVEEEARGVPSMFVNGDPETLNMMTAAIDVDPSNAIVIKGGIEYDISTPAGIYQMVGYGLGAKEAPGLVKRLLDNQAGKNDVYKDYRSGLASLYSNELFGDKDDYESQIKYQEIRRSLDAFLATEPTESEVQKFYSRLITDKVAYFWVDEDQLPGYDENEVEVPGPPGHESETFNVRFGTVVSIGDKRYQVIDRKDGIPTWLELPPERLGKNKALFRQPVKLFEETKPKYELGQNVSKNGKDYEIVGFDEDGEPLVNEVK